MIGFTNVQRNFGVSGAGGQVGYCTFEYNNEDNLCTVFISSITPYQATIGKVMATLEFAPEADTIFTLNRDHGGNLVCKILLNTYGNLILKEADTTISSAENWFSGTFTFKAKYRTVKHNSN